MVAGINFPELDDPRWTEVDLMPAAGVLSVNIRSTPEIISGNIMLRLDSKGLKARTIDMGIEWLPIIFQKANNQTIGWIHRDFITVTYPPVVLPSRDFEIPLPELLTTPIQSEQLARLLEWLAKIVRSNPYRLTVSVPESDTETARAIEKLIEVLNGSKTISPT